MTEFWKTLFGLMAGAAGYCIVTFWFQPILRYRAIKSQIISDLIFYANAIKPDGVNEQFKQKIWERVDANRRHSADLEAISQELPLWFRWWLSINGEKTAEASRELMGLSNTYEWKDVKARVAEIKKFLNIKS